MQPITHMSFGKRRVAAVSTFRSQWKTDNLSSGSSTSTQVSLPLVSDGTYNFTVNWGDGNSNTITTWSDTAKTHTYSTAGTYNITITGTITGWQFNNSGDRSKILSVTEWGSLRLQTATCTHSYFYGCNNLTLSTVSDTLNLTGTTSLQNCFRGNTSLTSINGLTSWASSGVTSYASFLEGCTNFNQNISGLNTSAATSLVGMLYGCTIFNNGSASGVANTLTLSTGNVTDMTNMFYSNSSMNCNVGGFDVSKNAGFGYMFYGCSVFNNGGSPSIGSWVIKSTGGGNVYTDSMFYNCTVFNQPIGSWNMSYVYTVAYMFYGATAFDQNLSGWKLEAVYYDNFMATKTPSTFSAANLDAFYAMVTNGWPKNGDWLTISFGTAKRTAASTAARAMLVRTYGVVTISGVANNGSGLVRITTASNLGLSTGDKCYISNSSGGGTMQTGWIVTKINNTTYDLQGSTYSASYTSGGAVYKGHNWTITDGGI